MPWASNRPCASVTFGGADVAAAEVSMDTRVKPAYDESRDARVAPREGNHRMLPSQRALFDIPREVCYLNAAAFSPLPRRGKRRRARRGAQRPPVAAGTGRRRRRSPSAPAPPRPA